jgi:hypothetical protein
MGCDNLFHILAEVLIQRSRGSPPSGFFKDFRNRPPAAPGRADDSNRPVVLA